MSDLTSLSHEYAAAADFAKEVNSAVVIIKKDQLKLRDLSTPDADTIQQARRTLSAVIQDLIRRLTASDARTEPAPEFLVPEDVVGRLESKHQSQMAYFIEDLRGMLQTLVSGTPLDEQHIALLDEICDAADASASATFRRLRRR